MKALSLAMAMAQNRCGAVPRPAWCTYLVTYRCNARCGMCDSWRSPPGAELTADQAATVFGRVGRLDVVRITGGEPFLRADLPEIAETVLRLARPAVLHVTTNGSFPERAAELARQCSSPRRLRFMVSLDGLAEEHNRNRGKSATFERALETVGRLAELRRTLGCEVSVNHTVISPKSLADSAGLRTELASLGVEVHSVLAYADSAMYGARWRGQKAEHLVAGAGYPLHPALAGADVAGFVRWELRRAAELHNLLLRLGKRYYLRGLLARLGPNGQPGGVPRARPKCVALRSHLRLLPDGRVPVCQFNTQTVGSLLEQPLPEVWHGRAAASARSWVDACPGCWAECEVLPNAIYSGDILRWW